MSTHDIHFAPACLIRGHGTNSSRDVLPLNDDEVITIVEADVATPDRLMASFREKAIHVSSSQVVVKADTIIPKASKPSRIRTEDDRHLHIEVVPLSPSQHRDLPLARATPILGNFRPSHSSRSVYYHYYRPKRILSPPVQRFKKRRQHQQVAAMITGGVVGGVLLGPVGAVLVGFVRKHCKYDVSTKFLMVLISCTSILANCRSKL